MPPVALDAPVKRARATKAKPEVEGIFGGKAVSIRPANMRVVLFEIEGLANLMIAKFSTKAMKSIKAKHEAGSQAKSKKVREARDFEADADNARHVSLEGWDGIHAAAFRNGMIDACRLTDLKMTQARLAIFCMEDGEDKDDGTPLVQIHSVGGHETSIMPVRNASGTLDLRARPMWRDWKMYVRLRYDADLMSVDDIFNLLQRVGMQVGIGEGRPYSTKGNGLGFGLFKVNAANDEGPVEMVMNLTPMKDPPKGKGGNGNGNGGGNA